MIGLNLTYKNKLGQYVDVTNKEPQYLYLNPYQKVITRYFFNKTTLDTNSTKIVVETVDIDLLTIKIRAPSSNVLSKYSDFDDIPLADGNYYEFEVDFSTSDTFFVDALIVSKTSERLKIKIRTNDDVMDSFETENTVSDGPNEFVKLVDVQISNSSVHAVFIHRRSGRLKKATYDFSYVALSYIFLDRIFTPNHYDSSFSNQTLTQGLAAEGWIIDYTQKVVFKEVDKRRIEATIEQIAEVIRKKGSAVELMYLLKSNEPTKHKLIVESEQALVSCDYVCSLAPVVSQTLVDTRG